MSLVPITTIKEIMLGSLKEYAAENGFTINNGKFSLNRRKNDCRQSLIFLSSYYVQTCVNPVAYIKIPLIGTICERCGFVYGGWAAQLDLLCAEKIEKEWKKLEEEQATSEECGHRIGGIINAMTHYRFDREFEIWDENDVHNASEKIHTLLPYAQKFFERYDGLESIDRSYNALPIRWDCYCISIKAQTVCGIIAAYVMRNPDYYEIKKGYLEALVLDKSPLPEKWGGEEMAERSYKECKDRFMKICDYLESFDSVEAMLRDLKEFKKKKKQDALKGLS